MSDSGASPESRSNAHHDLITGLVLAGLALFMFMAAGDIPLDEDEEGLGPRFFPKAICLCLGGLGLLMVAQFFGKQKSDANNSIFDAREFFTIACPLVLISMAYLWLFTAFGYWISTTLALYAGFFFFGVRGHALVWIPIIVASIFYVLFFQLMGIFEPPSSIWQFSLGAGE